MAFRMSTVAVRQIPSSIGSVASSMKKSLECRTKPRPVSTGPPFITFIASAVSGSLIWSDLLMMSSCTSKIGEIDAPGGPIDDNAHRALGRVRAHIDHRTREPLIFHDRHCNQQLAVQIAPAQDVSALAGILAAASSWPFTCWIHQQMTLMLPTYPDIGCQFCQSTIRPHSDNRSQAIQWFAAVPACKDVA